MDAASLLVIQISSFFLVIPIYIALFFIIYKIYYYEHLISNTNEFKNIKHLISRLNEPRGCDLSEITELAILVAKSAGEKLFNVFLKSKNTPQKNECNQGRNSQQKANETIEKLCGFVCATFCDICGGESNF